MIYEGPADAKVLIISDFQRVNCRAESQASVSAGEGPRVFSEYFGRTLLNAVKSAGLRSHEYAVMCIHSDVPVFMKSASGIPQDQRSRDIAALEQFLKTHPANVIVPLGEYVLEVLTGLDSIQKWQCSVVPAKASFGQRKCVPCYHPDYIMRAFGDHAYQLAAFVKVAREKDTPKINIPNRKFLLSPPFKETMQYLDQVVKRAPAIALDYEFGRGQINTAGFAISEKEAIAIKTLPEFYTPEEHFQLWQKIAEILENPKQAKYVQHYIVEASWSARYGIEMKGVAHDTMWAMKFLHPEFDKGLDNVGRLYTPFPYWKDDNDDWNNIKDWHKHLDYNCLSGDMKVLTEDGWQNINEMVRRTYAGKVMSYNEETQQMEWKPVIGWLRKKEKKYVQWVRVRTTSMGHRKGLRVTPDHRVLTKQRGWVEAAQLTPGDIMLSRGTFHQEGTLLGTLLGDSSLLRHSESVSPHVSCAQIHDELIELKAKLFGGTVTSAMRRTNYTAEPRLYHYLYVSPTEQATKFLGKAAKIAQLNKLNSMGLALWYMDDGCQQKHSTSPVMKLALQRYSNEQRKAVLDFFMQRYGEKASVDGAGNLRMSVPMSKAFCIEIGALVPEQLRYKLPYPCRSFSMDECMKYASDHEAQVERTITEVKLNQVTDRRAFAKVSYCITVEQNGNFLTQYGIVANCKDTTGTFAARNEQMQALWSRGLYKLYYQYIMRFAPIIQEMCVVGLRVNPVALVRLQENLQREAAHAMDTIDSECTAALGYTINPRSPKQLQGALKAMGFALPTKIVKGKTDAQETTDKKALVKLRRKYPDAQILPALIKLSAANKQLSSYASFEYDRAAERVHYSLDGCGTETGRWAGYNSAWGEGFNPQTVPKKVRSVFTADPDKVLVQIDLSQAESRYVAWEAPEPKLMQMLQEKRDVHKFVAAQIYKKPEEFVNPQERQLGKKAGHASNYDVGPRTFAESCLVEMNHYITEQEARQIIGGYNSTFPGIWQRKQNIKKEVYAKRCLRTPIGRERHFYGRMDDQTFREAYAYAPQSVIPDITNHLMLHLWENRDYLGLSRADGGYFLLQVHDSLLLQTTRDRVFEIAEVARDLKAWHPKISLPGGELWIPVEVEYGDNWNKMEPV